MRYLISCAFAGLIISLSGCEAPPGPNLYELDNLPVIDLKATDAVDTPEPMVKATFVPNSVASWLGHVILLSETGSIWRTSSNGARPVLIDEGPFTDIHGLFRKEAAGVFVGSKDNGEIIAFLQIDDAGTFKRISLSQDGLDFKQFCNNPASEQIQIITQGNQSTTLSSDIEGVNDQNEGPKSSVIDVRQSDTKCLENKYQILSPETAVYFVKNRLIFEKNQSPHTQLSIIDGLSIQGVETPSFLSGTSHSMGSTFNGGMYVVGDADNNRLVFLSGGYLETELK